MSTSSESRHKHEPPEYYTDESGMQMVEFTVAYSTGRGPDGRRRFTYRRTQEPAEVYEAREELIRSIKDGTFRREHPEMFDQDNVDG